MTLLHPLRLIEGSRLGFAYISFSEDAQGSGEVEGAAGLVRRLEICLGRAVLAVREALGEEVGLEAEIA